MRKAATTLAVACSLAILVSTLAHGAPLDAAGAIAQARRLIEANDHPAAVVLLEDALIEAQSKDRPTIVHLLRQSYTVMAKRAEDAGRTREAAYYRDNLAILNRDQEPPARSKQSDDTSKPTAPVKPAGAPAKPAAAPEPSPETAADAPAFSPAPAAPPASAPEPVPTPNPARPNAQTPSHQDSQRTEKTTRDRKPVSPPRTEPESAFPARANPQSALDPLPEPASISEPGASKREPSPAVNAGAAVPVESGPDPAVAAPLSGAKTAPAKATVEEADRLYVARNFREAGRCYSELARESRLPAERKEHWAYCRYFALVEWINRGPRSQREWDQIVEELASIQRLAPKGWYGEYLRNLIAEVRRKGPRAQPQSENLVVRGSAPDDTQPKRFPRFLGKGRSRTNPQPEAAPQAAVAAEQPLELPVADSVLPPAAASSGGQSGAGASANANVRTGAGPAGGETPGAPLEPLDVDVHAAGAETSAGPGSEWQIHETANFRIFHHDARLAQSAGDTAEAVRAAQAKKWGSQAAAKTWTPACEIYLYPDGKALAAATQQPENSPGFSTMSSNGTQVVARRVNLRADHPQLLPAILPHEVTHVVLADIFIARQIPRWADEGLAVLAEPRSEQQLRWAELQEPLEKGRLFELSKLMGMDYPEPKDWSLYYAQSVSLTRFLVEQDSPERFIRFVLDSHQKGIEAALEDAYQIKGFPELQARWTAYARQQAATLTASARDASDGSSPATRR